MSVSNFDVRSSNSDCYLSGILTVMGVIGVCGMGAAAWIQQPAVAFLCAVGGSFALVSAHALWDGRVRGL